MNKEILVPFDGFYNSIPEGTIDDTIEMELNEYSEEEAEEIQKNIPYGKIFIEYSKLYLEFLVKKINENFEFLPPLELKFVVLDSPREYNYTTDRIFAEISSEHISQMYNLVVNNPELRKDLSILVQKTYTSDDGFISLYKNDWQQWGDCSSWDHNQLGALLQILVEDILGTDLSYEFDNDYEYWERVREMIEIVIFENK